MRYSRLIPSSETSWRPPFLRRRFLLFVVILCVLVVAAIQLVINACNPSSSGCRVFGGEFPDRVSTQTQFVYNVLPTLLSVCFSLLWALAHHDILRMEPWFQLSKPDGATAQDSLLLEYPYLFPPYILWVSAKLRHPHVFLSTLILLFISLLLTPLSSALFDEATLTRHSLLPTTYPLPPFANSTNIITTTPTFAYAAFSHYILNASLPAYTTRTYSLPPFSHTPSANFTAPTIRSSSTLSCAPPLTSPILASGRTVGYNLTSPFSPSTFHTIFDAARLRDDPTLQDTLGASYSEWMYPEFIFSASASWHLLHFTPDAPSDDAPSQLFLFTGPWKDSNATSLPEAWTAVWCEPAYWTQNVNATILAGGVVDGVVETGEKEAVDAGWGNGFWNAVLMGNFGIAEGDQDALGLQARFGYAYTRLPRMEERLLTGVGVGNDARGMEAWAVREGEVGEMMDAGVLGERLEKVFRMLFAFYVTYGYGEQKGADEVHVEMEVQSAVRGYRVNERWARGAQASFAGVAGLMAVLVFIGGRRCRLDGEPGSLAAGLGLLARSEGVVGRMENAEFHEGEKLKAVLKDCGGRYRMQLAEGVGPRIEVLGGEERRLEKGDMPYYRKHGWPGAGWSGVVYVGLFGAVLATLIAVFSYSEANRGFSTARTQGTFWQPFTFSYVPTFFGLVFEPMLVTLSNHYCMFGPYLALVRGKVASKNSLALDFDSTPPHFKLLYSWKVRDLSLGALTLAILATNGLAAALGGLFSSGTAEIEVNIAGTTRSQVVVMSGFESRQEESFYRLLTSNMGDMDVPVPAWTTNTHYVLPVSLSLSLATVNVSIPTLGVGATITCSVLPPDAVSIKCSSSEYTDIPCKPDMGDYPGERAIDINDACWDKHPMTSYDDYDNISIVSGVVGMGVFARSQSCDDTFFILWAEYSAIPNPGNTTMEGLYSNNWDSAVMKCTSGVEVVKLSATVDKDKRVLASQGVEPTSFTNGSDLIQSFTESIVPIVTKQNIQGQASLTVWLDYLLKTLYPDIVQHGANLTRIPDREVLPGAFEDLYRRLFAISLSLNADQILSSAESSNTPAIVVLRDERMVVSKTMFSIAAAILGYTIVVLTTLYSGRTRRSWKAVIHEPVSLVGMWAGLYSSDVKAVCGKLRGAGPRERAKSLQKKEGKYSYGTFRAADGKTHVGVFSERVVEEQA